MRPFLLSKLKCPKCSSTKMPSIQISAAEKVPQPASGPSVKELGFAHDQLLHIIDQAKRAPHVGGLDIEEADAEEYKASGDETKIKELLYGVDVRQGAVICVDCGGEMKVREGILYCLE